MKTKKPSHQTPHQTLSRNLTIVAWIIAALSLIGIVVATLCAVSQATLDFQTSVSNSPISRPSLPDASLDERPADPALDNQPDARPGQLPTSDQQNPDREDYYRPELENHSAQIALPYVVIIVLFILLFSLSAIFLIMSAVQRDFYHNPDRVIILVLASTLATMIISTATIFFANLSIDTSYDNPCPTCDSSTPRNETDFIQDNVATSNRIDLSEQTSDLTISAAGTYTLTGEFTHSVIIDSADADVRLLLDNITITNPSTAAIVGLAAQKITISTTADSINRLTDGGNSVYDGCIYSNAELVFEGEGTLEVNGQQSEGEGIATETQPITFKSGTYHITSNDDGINAGGDGSTITIDGGTFYIDANGDGIDSNQNAVINGGAIFVIGSDTGGDAGIDTDDGFAINGGTVIALGSAMIETPLTTSQQNSLAFTLTQSIAKDTPVALLDSDGKAVLSFSAPKSFRTLVLSSPDLRAGNYQLSSGGAHSGTLRDGIYQGGAYSGGNLLSVNNTTTFEIKQTVNTYGISGSPSRH